MLSPRAGLAALVVCCAVELPSFAQAPFARPHLDLSSKPEAGASDQGSPSKPQATPNPPVIIQVVPPEKTEEEAKQQREEASRKSYLDARLVELTADLAKYTQWLAYATIALVLFTGGLVLFALKQARDMKAAIDHAATSANAATDAAKAAKDQVVIARQSLVSTQRAFVTFNRTKTKPIKVPGGDRVVAWRFEPVFANKGSTPAVNVVTDAWYHLVDGQQSDLPEDFKYPGSSKKRKEVVNIAPQDKIHHAIEIGNTVFIEAGRTKSFFIYGWAEYDDTLGSGERHRSEFCTKVEPEGDLASAECKFFLMHVGPFNGFDGDCWQKPAPYQR